MKNVFFLGVVFALLIGCSTSNSTVNTTNTAAKSDTVRIANDELQYEVIIIDAGFNSWLASSARPRGYYSETFLEDRNDIYVREWNSRVLQPQRYGNLYEMQINYERRTKYGYEVNYLIYNYLTYFQIKNKQQLGGFAPRP